MTIAEGSASDKVMCTAQAWPEASIQWRFGGHVVATDNFLFFDRGVNRGQAGEYLCSASNRHGEASEVTRIEVLCKKFLRNLEACRFAAAGGVFNFLL